MSPALLGLLALESLGWLRMSRRDANRIEVPAEVVAGRIPTN